MEETLWSVLIGYVDFCSKLAEGVCSTIFMDVGMCSTYPNFVLMPSRFLFY